MTTSKKTSKLDSLDSFNTNNAIKSPQAISIKLGHGEKQL